MSIEEDSIFCANAEDFSMRFLGDPNPPSQLFMSGFVDIDAYPTVGIIGARNATPYGIRVAEDFGEKLCKAGIVVVSGLASGIDAAGHRGALRAHAANSDGAPLLGVVGGGIDMVYPYKNANVWDGVLSHGLIISEYECGTPPEKWRFPARNRIIAALSDVLIVVEARHRSGTIHTVDAAQERDRLVLAVPGPITSPQSGGTNHLICEGAVPLLDLNDVLLALTMARPDLSHLIEFPPDKSARLPFLEGPELHVFRAVDVVPGSFESIARRTGFSFAETARLLTGLVNAGRVVKASGGYVRS